MSARDWGGLRSIVEEAKKIDEVNRDRKAVACPLCGTPLQFRGDLADCPMGHWQGDRNGPV